MKKGLILLIGVIILVGIMLVSCPNRQAHKDAMVEEYKSAINESTAAEGYGGFEIFTGFIGTGLVNFYLEQYLYVDNYFLFSLGKMTDPQSGEKKVVSIGVFNHVFCFIDKKKFMEALSS